jgi:cell division protein FtsQ
MAGIARISRTELVQRRKRLRQQRRFQQLRSLWRFMLVAALTLVVVWVVQQPIWVIRSAEQVQVSGNQLLTVQTVRQLAALNYPQSIFRIQPQQIIQALQEKTLIAHASVERHLFPPGITIHVQERLPVAVMVSAPVIPSATDAQPTPGSATPNPLSPLGLLDEFGDVIAIDAYQGLNQALQLPALKVIGNPDQYRPDWPAVYQAQRRSPVAIQQIDWRDPNNLVMETELGIVHFGPLSGHLPEQLRALDRLRQLPQKIPRQQIAYIDLRNPQAPVVQQTPASQSSVKSGTP